MLKKVLTKAVAGTLVAAGLLVVPTAVTGGTELALMAKKTGCQYDVAQTTTTKLEGLPSAIRQATAAFSGSATVEGPAAIPRGTMSVTRAAYASGSYGTLGNAGGLRDRVGSIPDPELLELGACRQHHLPVRGHLHDDEL